MPIALKTPQLAKLKDHCRAQVPRRDSAGQDRSSRSARASWARRASGNPRLAPSHAVAALAGALGAFNAQHIELALDVAEDKTRSGHLALLSPCNRRI